ncbi:uncharacterized protein LOC143286770 isoform X2 [Babylonia areolata]|uniref:uncharacterized protein LOC143286770 isoform X2 n=1 Tax=Babylonia areolata TaxID=304850 RepID=UPI003FCF806E
MYKLKAINREMMRTEKRVHLCVPFSRLQIGLSFRTYHVWKDSSDSGVDGAMGNNSSGPTPAVYYSPEYGVALGRRTRSPKEQEEVDNVRLRRMGTSQKPPRRLDIERDNSSGRGSSLSSPQYDQPLIRESFYSTAESGFETLPEVTEEEEADSTEELSPSLKENYSVSSLKERSDRYFASLQGNQTGTSPPRDDLVPLQDQGEANGDLSVPVVRTEPASSSGKSSSLHSGERVWDSNLLSARKGNNNASHSEDYEDDPSLEVSESLRSFNSSGEEWSWEDEEKDTSPYLAGHPVAMTDSQFRQSLMQRIRDWSTFAEDYGKTPSPMPDPALMQARRISRSRSLDHHLGEPMVTPEVVEMSSTDVNSGQEVIQNLESLETEVHDIQGEFESITSKLHELIEKGGGDRESGQRSSFSTAAARTTSPSSRPHPHLSRSYHHSGRGGRPPHHTPPHHHHQQRGRTKWERMPSMARSDSSRSSRASSVDFSWDCGEAGLSGLRGRGEVEGEGVTATESADAPGGAGGEGQEDGGAVSELSEDGGDQVTSIGKAVPIVDYAAQEWKGDTPKAHTIRQGYLAIPEMFSCQHLRQVRGDNYCALRSTLFQVLVGGHRVTQRWPGLIAIVERLHELNADSNSGLSHWTFGGRLRCEGEEERFSIVAQCVLSLYVMVEEIIALPTPEERLARTLSLLNGSERFDAELMEGLKLMMLFGANDLQQGMRREAEVPTFAWLLFARDTSMDLVSFVRNHLNCVGDSAGIDQVEMSLLGHCLGVRLRVARLDHHGQEDFECTFPDEAPPEWPSICLLAEDDRHYNVPVA